MFGFFSAGFSAALDVAAGYSSGEDISTLYPNSESTFGVSVADLNIVEGTYSFTSGLGGDSVTLVVNSIPEPSSALLLGLAGLGLVSCRRRIC